MRILHVIPAYYPAFQYGGPIQSVFLLNKHLIKIGVHVDVLTTVAGQRQTEKINIHHNWKNVDNHRVWYMSYIGYEHFNFSIPFFKMCKRLIPEYDLVHITGVWNFPVWAAAYWARQYGKPYIISPRGVLYPEAVQMRSFFIKRTYYHLIAKKYLHHARLLHYTTEDEQDKTQAYLDINTPSIVIPNGIDMDNINHKNLISYSLLKPYILFLGRIHPKKGLELLIKAFTEILHHYPGFHLYIVGEGDPNYEKNLHQLVSESGIHDNVHFLGAEYGEEKWYLYQQAYLFVLPSLSENFGMSVIEAMACNCPVVISNHVGLHIEVQTNQVGLVHQLNANNLSKAILTFIRHPEMRNQYAYRARKFVEEKFDIKKVAAQMKQAYQRILSSEA